MINQLDTVSEFIKNAKYIDKKNILVPVADGSEEIESMSIIGTLIRADANVVTAKVFSEDEKSEDLTVKMSRGVKVIADVALTDDMSKINDLFYL